MQTILFLAKQQAEQQSILPSLIMMGLIFIIFWVILIRPQKKRQQELKARQDSVKKGDKVVTIGGMHGIVNAVGDNTISIKVGENTLIKYDKGAIARVGEDVKSPDSQSSKG